MPDEKDLHDPRNPAYMDSYKREMELFHECPNCNDQCSCHDEPCSCCGDEPTPLDEDGNPVVSPEFEKRKWIEEQEKKLAEFNLEQITANIMSGNPSSLFRTNYDEEMKRQINKPKNK